MSDEALVPAAWERGPAGAGWDQAVHEAVSSWARRTPNAIALQTSARAVTYRELDERANQVAHLLLERGVGPDVPVPVVFHRGPELVIAQLAVLKAGGAFLSIDPGWPAHRLAQMVGEAGAPVILGEATTIALMSWEARSLAMCLRPDLRLRTPTTAPGVVVSPGNLAYVTSTSGSSGRPKGALTTHGGLGNLCSWHRRKFGLTSSDRVTVLANVAFDGLVLEVWPGLVSGAQLHILDEGLEFDAAAVTRAIIDHGITQAFVPTGLVRSLIDFTWPPESKLGTVVTGGDRLRWPGRTVPWKLLNAYGPTEATVLASIATVESESSAAPYPPIGRPIDNVTTYVLDSRMRRVPVGTTGELCIGGRGVGRGYLGQPALTAERFVPDPFGPPGAVMYRTGDLARWSSCGCLEFVGRLDDQVKVRGHRVELGEIEAVLRDHPGVEDTFVTTRSHPCGARHVVAFLVGSADPASIRAALADRLPDFMVPARIAILPRMPLTANGKIDREALAEVPLHDQARVVGSVDVELAEIMREALGEQSVGPTDNFFALGGHSLLAAAIVTRVREGFGVDIAVRDFLSNPTVEGLAAIVRRARQDQT